MEGIIFLVIILFLILYIIINKNKTGFTKIKVNKKEYFRDIPCNGNLELAYWLLYNYSNMKKRQLQMGLIQAYLLKWYKGGNITINNENGNIYFNNKEWQKSEFEDYLCKFLKDIAGNNAVLEKNEINYYCMSSENSFKMDTLFEKMIDSVEKQLKEKKLIQIVREEGNTIYNKKIVSEKLEEEYKNMIRFKNYLEMYSNMKDKKHIEIELWEEYMIFASLLGITNKIKGELKNAYPELNVIETILAPDFKNNEIESTYAASVVLIFPIILLGITYIPAIIRGDFKISENILFIAICILSMILLYIPMKQYLVNKKVNEMNEKCIGTITEVKGSINEGEYSYTYEYVVNGKKYRGDSILKTNLKVLKVNQPINIYYNKMNPNKSQTKEERYYYLKIFFGILIPILILYCIFLKISM